MHAKRECSPHLAEARKLYSVKISAKTIAGVQTDIVMPAERVPEKK